ncbi:hypothetical protein SISNIDRAFT_407056 [Sistotremastrum niveocremeum HHB9708]|uniref:Uncharacterized protein n=1 Tax=Sistotremastrum niveocremeum HHB9708 TaxID=1314777 RepID=A0A164YKR5_9AGAM|nr:hypothetical protein SISNIDRAFT_407056 [Sistotremastrum niveocremeum HHB9708]
MSHKKATSDASSLNTRLVTPSSPRFLPLSVRWKGLTYEAAQWTLTSSELQDIARAAIRKSAGPSSIRILPPKVYNQDLPMEVEKLEQMREEAKQKYKAQVRRRRVLLRSLSLYCDGSDAAAAVRYTEDLAEVTASCDKLAEEIFQATDQLAQINRLRDVHYASALAMSLQKLNKSLLRQTAENNDLKTKIASLEAEREEAWGMAESLASEMQELEFKLERDGVSTPSSSGLTNSRPSSRVSAARKTSMRASKASLRLSTSKKSVRSSMASSMRRASSTSLLRTPPSAFVTHGHTADIIPPVPPMPMPGRFVSHDWPLTTQSSLMMTPSTSNHALSRAQDDVMEMLGITLHELGHGRGRSQSVSQSQTTPVESNPPSSFSYYFESPGSRVSRPSSDGFAPLRVRRHSISSMPSQAPLYSPAQNAGDQVRLFLIPCLNQSNPFS